MTTINAERPMFRTSLVDRAAKNIDWATVELARQAEAARARTERIAQLRHIVFRNAVRGRCDIEDLTNEPAASRILIRAGNSADGFAVLGVLQVAIEHRWSSVVYAGIRYFGEQPVAQLIQELWDLTADRTVV